MVFQQLLTVFAIYHPETPAASVQSNLDFQHCQ